MWTDSGISKVAYRKLSLSYVMIKHHGTGKSDEDDSMRAIENPFIQHLHV